MRKVILLFSVLVLFVSSNNLIAATGWFNDFIKLSVNGGAEASYWIGTNPGSGTQLQGNAFGTVSSFQITGCDMKYSSTSSDRLGGAFYYKIMSSDGSTQIVAPVEIIWTQSDLTGGNYQGTKTTTINLLSGLTYGTTYQLHIWAKSWGGTDGDSWLSNSGANYVATFTTQTIINGSFEGELVWGSPKTVADQTAGWDNANAKRLYVTFDATYIYLGAEVVATDWHQWAFIINTKEGGGTSDSWTRDITYGHANKPDYVARGTFGGYAEFHSWNGSSWVGVGSGIAGTEFGENISGTAQAGWVEVRVLRSVITAYSGDVQFYITGNENAHATFDACPDDQVATNWSGSPTTLDNYSIGVPFPVELTSFGAKQTGNNVTLNWKTATEVNNYGFEVQKSTDNSTWNKIGFVQGAGNSNSPKEYSYTDKLSNLNGKFYYRLKQMDNDGTISFSKVVEVLNSKPSTLNLSQNYPNPFNPSTVIKYQIPVDSRVSIKVYNVLGNVVATLQNGFQTAGEYSVTLDGSNLASGVYFYKIEAGEFSATKKMLLTK